MGSHFRGNHLNGWGYPDMSAVRKEFPEGTPLGLGIISHLELDAEFIPWAAGRYPRSGEKGEFVTFQGETMLFKDFKDGPLHHSYPLGYDTLLREMMSDDFMDGSLYHSHPRVFDALLHGGVLPDVMKVLDDMLVEPLNIGRFQLPPTWKDMLRLWLSVRTDDPSRVAIDPETLNDFILGYIEKHLDVGN